MSLARSVLPRSVAAGDSFSRERTPPPTPRLARWSLQVFLVVGWLVMISRFISVQVSDSLGSSVGLLGLFIYPLCLGAAVYFYEKSPGPSPRISWAYLWALTGYLGFLILYAVVLGNPVRLIAFDCFTYWTVLGAFILGRRDSVWRDIRLTVTILSGLSVLLAIRFTDSMVLTDRSILNEQSGSQFEAALTLAPLLALVAATTEVRNRWYVPLLVITAGCLFVYLYFGRRGISVRCALELFAAAAVLPAMLRQQRRIVLAVVGFILFAAAIVLYFPFDVLIERFQGRYGVATTVLSENERWAEVRDLAEELEGTEWLVGRGMGGVFLANQIQSLSVDRLTGDEFGRTSTHAGAALPFLKGGVILFVLYFLPLVRVIARLRNWRRLDPITLAAAVSGLALVAFQSIEGTITYSTPWVSFGIGLIMARVQLGYMPPPTSHAVASR
ncbi:MAG: hypothetical protein HZA32_14825 [Opitutae bacterium]|nr:hypothetical protein [Opitutae bacterium]